MLKKSGVLGGSEGAGALDGVEKEYCGKGMKELEREAVVVRG